MSNYNKQDYIMISDAMNAIQYAECEDFVKNFNDPFGGFSTCRDPRINEISKHIGFTGHSGCSFASTLRNCQHLLQNPSVWTDLKNKYSNRV